MSGNIVEIISLQIPKNNIIISGECNYKNAPINWHHRNKYLCKNCVSLVCKFCINYNETKCGICLTNKYGFCKFCKEKIRILPCSKCKNVIKKCDFTCHKYIISHFENEEGFYCKHCK